MVSKFSGGPCAPLPEPQVRWRDHRSSKVTPSHLRTLPTARNAVASRAPDCSQKVLA